ncbi:hypothetical protein [Kitasatospora indigofera]|uniref:hypothetical protein n=1 Tax=Kitasatospora indigofera TaxID=67307 RepID=UPI0036A8DF16
MPARRTPPSRPHKYDDAYGLDATSRSRLIDAVLDRQARNARMSVEYRGARLLAALQTALLTAAAEWDLGRVLSFHHFVAEARALSIGLRDVAKMLCEQEPALHPAPELIGTSWLESEHTVTERRQTLGNFSSLLAGDGLQLLRYVLASVKVLSEGVDTFDCDSVFFADVRGSMVDLVQAVGGAADAPGQREGRHHRGAGHSRCRGERGPAALLPGVRRAGEAVDGAGLTRRGRRRAPGAATVREPAPRASRGMPATLRSAAPARPGSSCCG